MGVERDAGQRVIISREIMLDNPTAWKWACKFIESNYLALIEQGKPLSVRITNSEKTRNAEQNKRHWKAVLQPIAEQVWIDGRQFSKEVWHEYYAGKYGYFEELTLPDGAIVLRRKSTTEYKVKEFSDYMTNVEADAAQEFGVRFQEYVR